MFENCNLYIDCDNNQYTPEMLFKAIIGVDENGCPVLKTSPAGGGSVPTGGSTELKQDAIIAELMKDKDFEIACVEDINTGVVYFFRQTLDESTNTIVNDYINAQGVVVVPPNPSDLRVCNPATVLNNILLELQNQSGILQDIDDNTDQLEALSANALTELQAININTDGIEALITASNLDLSAISTTLSGQTALLNAIITILSNINTAVNTADANNVSGLNTIGTQLTSVIAQLTAIGANTAPLEASLTAIESAINSGNLDLALIQTNTLNTVNELQSANTTLLNINSQFSGSTVNSEADITGNGAYVVPANTYNSIQLIVVDGEVFKGNLTYPPGVYSITGFGNKLLGTRTYDASAATAYLDFEI